MNRKISGISIIISFVAFVMNILSMVLLARYFYIGNIFFNVYFIVMIFVQIPILHY